MSRAAAEALPRSQLVLSSAEAGVLQVTAVQTDSARATVQLHGEVDLANAELVTAVLDNQLALGHRYLRLDLSGVSFLDCTGLSALVHAHNQFLAARGTLVLAGVGARIARILSLTHLDEALFMTDGLDDPRPTRRRSHLNPSLHHNRHG